MKLLDKIGKQVKARRQRVGWTQEELAKKAKITRATVVSIEKGEHACSIETLYRICSALHLTIDELIGTGNKLHPSPRRAVDFYLQWSSVLDLLQEDRTLLKTIISRLRVKK